MDQLCDRISALLKSNDPYECPGALRVIDELIDLAVGENALAVGENASMVLRFSNYLRMVLEVNHDERILVLASNVLGHLARAGGVMMNDEIERQLEIALDWLREERVKRHRLAAVLILKEMAENASTVFYLSVPKFVNSIWFALRDPEDKVREHAVEALRACLYVIEKRETRWRMQWYYHLFKATQDGLGRNAPMHSIHGSLLSIGELLRNTGEFMMSRNREVTEIVLRYLDHKDLLVRCSVTLLLPRIAYFLRDQFVAQHLTMCMKHIFAVLQSPAERASGFIALGEMAGALDGKLIEYLPTIMSHICDAIAPRKGRPSLEALACVGSIAKVMGPVMEPHIRGILDAMFSAGISPILVEALEKITTSIPSLLPPIQTGLLSCFSSVLSKPHGPPEKRAALVRGSMVNTSKQISDISGSALVQLALQTLARFNFKGKELLEFAKESVVIYLDDGDRDTRKAAALCCFKMVLASLSIVTLTQFGSAKSSQTGRKQRRLIEEFVEKLLIAAVTDADVTVRRSIFCILMDRGLDDYLAQASSLSALFAALNDEDLAVREYAITVVGRLSKKNPAYVLPAFRRQLINLLTCLEQSADSKCREESVQLLGCLIRNCEWLIRLYMAPIQKALIASLVEVSKGNTNTGILSRALVTVGDLARVGGCAMRQYLLDLIPLIVNAIVEGSAVIKREVAVSTLSQVVQSTGYVIMPYNEYPPLLGSLLLLLHGELAWSTRREVLKVLGIMGALDPLIHKQNQLLLASSHGKAAAAAGYSGHCIQHLDEVMTDNFPSFATCETNCSMVVINSLMQILNNPSLDSYHHKVVDSLIFLFKLMGLGCIQFLPKVLPDLFHILRKCDDKLKDFIAWKLGTLVSIVRQHINKYRQELLSLISELWSSLRLPAVSRPPRGFAVLHLVEQLCLALGDGFKTYVRDILPYCIQFLSDVVRCNDYRYVLDVLHTLETFGGTLGEHMHLLLPALIQLFKENAPVDKRSAAIKTLTKLIPRVQVTDHVSLLVHQLKLVLDGEIDELRKDAIEALCCLAYALGKDFTIFIPSIHKLLLKHQLRHKEFKEIEECVQSSEPLISWNETAQKLSHHLATDVMSDPLSDSENDLYEDASEVQNEHRVYRVNDGRLLAAGEASQCCTKEDWAEWMRHFSIEVMKQSPFPALRTCARLAQLQPLVGKELFAAGFWSCWLHLSKSSQEHLIQNLELAFSAPNISAEILAALLNLAEFFEHYEKPLPIDIRVLGALAQKFHAFAKALYYKEMEFESALSKKKMDASSVALVEDLIHINHQLDQHEAAVGLLTVAQQHLDFQLESWYEKLQQWDDALQAYNVRASEASSPHLVLNAILGQMRCLAALARWEELNNLCKEYWTPAEPAVLLEMAPMAATAAWNMGEWDQMAEYVSRLDNSDDMRVGGLVNSAACGDGNSNGTFFRAVISVRRGKYDEAHEYIERARKCLATELAALVLESYDRAYSHMIRVQQLLELEEVIDYCTLPVENSVAGGRRDLIRSMWTERIKGVKRNVEVWQSLLAVRTLVLPPTEDVDTWLEFSRLCRKNGRISQARSILIKLLQFDPEICLDNLGVQVPPQVMLEYLELQWSLGDNLKQKNAFHRLQNLAVELSSVPNVRTVSPTSLMRDKGPSVPLLARLCLKLGTWKWELSPGLDDESIKEILGAFKSAIQCASEWSEAWHTWALFNTAVSSHYTLRGYLDVAAQYVVAAVTGYFHTIACAANAKGDNCLQDILRLLTLWFNHGATIDVQMAMEKGFAFLNITTWLDVLPQVIARIHSKYHAVLIQSLLVRIGQSHPQALMYPVLVACKAASKLRRAAAQEVVDKVRQHSGVLVDQAQLVSKELVRVALPILWHEKWNEALEEAGKQYKRLYNVEAMLKVLEPLHESLLEGAKRSNPTIHERAFIKAYYVQLMEAHDCCMRYKRTGNDAELRQAWNLYTYVYMHIKEQLPSLNNLDLQSLSPKLLECCNLELAVPGTYRADMPVVTIASFSPKLLVLTSKQRPRKLTIHGSNGEEYTFLLKGHEDLRQDERVMQLFGLVNTLMENSSKTSERDLPIQRYSVIPLDPNSGLIGWVPNCDTLHQAIQEYRHSREIPLDQEYIFLESFSPENYNLLPLLAKVEALKHVLQKTEGDDLKKVLWLKSRTSEVWLKMRTNFTRSLAVMSMVGYLLGLGDRHLGNIMLHHYSGKIVHIDFGDCFEVSMNREEFPEKVPFRLTRMLVKAMEVSGVEGNFRSTCENVMQVLRTNKDSVMAIMEAFVHDPLINWRLFPKLSMLASAHVPSVMYSEESSQIRELAQPQRGAWEREILQAIDQLGNANEVLNKQAVAVMARMSDKLTGRDFSNSSFSSISNQHSVNHCNLTSGDSHEVDPSLSIKLQVQKLIVQATSHENLCQIYLGWGPFW